MNASHGDRILLDFHTHLTTLLGQKQIHEWRGLSLFLFIPSGETLRVFFECLFQQGAFHKIKFISIDLAPKNPQEFLPLIILQCATATAEKWQQWACVPEVAMGRGELV
jgi:hypothetical protein